MSGSNHHRQKQGCQCGCISHRRTRKRRHDDGCHDGHIAQPPFDVANQGHGKVNDTTRQAPGIHDFASEHEKGNRQQRETVCTFEQILRKNLSIEIAHVHHQCHTA